jgi:hypothetical protein
VSREEWAKRWHPYRVSNLVMEFVERRGYGPWHQRDAWNEIKDWTPMGYPIGAVDWFVYDYLDERYPSVLEASLESGE